MRGQSLRRQLLLSTTMLVGALTGYGGRAHAACTLTTPPNQFTCTAAETTQQTITTDNAQVTTEDGFSVVTGDARALSITAAGDLTYTDENDSTLTAANSALYMRSTGDAGAVPGSVTIDTNGALTGGTFGIVADNVDGRGALTIEANGDVTGTGSTGIFAQGGGTDLSVTTGVSTTVTGGSDGIIARNIGDGALTIEANGDVSGSSRTGISAVN
jgi:hypothetical protein